MKLLIDHFPEMIILVSGSSSFDLSSKVGEPLTGRNIVRNLFPISVLELNEQFGGMYVLQKLEKLLIYGAYPDVLNAPSSRCKKEYLMSIRDSYLGSAEKLRPRFLVRLDKDSVLSTSFDS